MVSAKRKNIWRDESGAALVEFTAAMFTFFLLLFGVTEFAFAFYQWNAATKAVQLGARLAAVSNPVASDLTTLTGVGGSVLPGDPMPAFDRVCTSTNASGSAGACTSGTYSAAAMQTIVFGRGKTACATPTSDRDVGMCNIFDHTPPLTPQNVIIRYQYTGLGYAGRPGGPVPTITVSLTGLTYNFVMIGGLVPGLSSMQLPSFATTVTGEDLNVAGS
jgi:Flp pilus assembly protein TadG